jgi:hypothetical protein
MVLPFGPPLRTVSVTIEAVMSAKAANVIVMMRHRLFQSGNSFTEARALQSLSPLTAGRNGEAFPALSALFSFGTCGTLPGIGFARFR